MDKITDKEAIREYLTLHSGYSSVTPMHSVSIQSCNYEIDLCGWISYIGQTIWKIGDISFPLDKVKAIWTQSRKVVLE